MTPTNPPPKKAPKQFWIAIYKANIKNYITKFSYSAFTDDRDCGPDFVNVHVIEASYAKELEAEIEYLKRSLADERSGDTDLMKTISRHERNIKTLTEKLAVAEKALEFYADGEGDVLDWDRVNNPACTQDRGKTAREALASIRGNKNG